MKPILLAFAALPMVLAGCHHDDSPPPLLGTLEWDRIAARNIRIYEQALNARSGEAACPQ